MQKGYKALLADANAVIAAITPEQAASLLKDPDGVPVDLRERREVDLEGRINGTKHCPRGMLEFWIDPEPLP